MKRTLVCLVPSLVLLASLAAPVRADLEAERATFERKVEAELEALDPGALDLLREAELAREGGSPEQARPLYQQLLERVPGFHHAQRRLCWIEAELGNAAKAVALCRAALSVTASPENQLALANALLALSTAEPRKRTGHLREAETLIDAALREDPSVQAYAIQCQLAMVAERIDLLDSCSEAIREQAPGEVGGWWLSAMAAGTQENWADARRYLERAHELGLPDDEYDRLSQLIDDNEPVWPTVLKVGGIAIGVWLALMLLLVVAGALLSRRTVRAAEALTGADAAEPVHAAGASLRATYRRVLQASCYLYYLSLPLLIAVVVVTGGGILYGFWVAGWIPVKLALIIGVITVVTVGAILKSLVVRPDDGAPGQRLDLAAHPELGAVLDEVAAKVGTRPVDNVYLTPGTELAVFERGSVMKQLRGGSERCLILGIAVLDDLPLPAFKAILAHEYGHFTNRDTAGGGLALAVRRSLVNMGVGLAESGSAAWYNPAWLFFQVYYRVFLRISHGASRLQEILADRWAVLSYGAPSFETGLRHAIAASVRFDAHTARVIGEVMESETPLENLYRYQPAEPPDPDEVDEAIEEALDAAPSQYDSHPRPADRIRWAHAMNAPTPDDAGDDRDATTLLHDRPALELEMTDQVRTNVLQNHGFLIP